LDNFGYHTNQQERVAHVSYHRVHGRADWLHLRPDRDTNHRSYSARVSFGR